MNRHDLKKRNLMEKGAQELYEPEVKIRIHRDELCKMSSTFFNFSW